MGSTRTITYGSISNTAGAQTAYSGAETWGELKSGETAIGLLATGMSALVGGTSEKLTSDSQKLPEGDFALYFVLEKNNSGNAIG